MAELFFYRYLVKRKPKEGTLAFLKLDHQYKERGKNKYTFLAASFAHSFSFEISHYINITPAFKEKTKNKISYPRIHIYLYLVPKN